MISVGTALVDFGATGSVDEPPPPQAVSTKTQSIEAIDRLPLRG